MNKIIIVLWVTMIMYVTGSGYADSGLPYWNGEMFEHAKSVMEQIDKTQYTSQNYVCDIENGKLNIDCSGYVGLILQDVSFKHYDILPKSSSGGTTALAQDYFDYIKKLPLKADKKLLWKRVSSIRYALPGDIMVYKNDEDSDTTGHAMLIYSKPKKYSKDEYTVKVNDSANSGHYKDTRGKNKSGVGVGTMWIKTKGTDYYRWRSAKGPKHKVEIMIGRLVE